MVLLRKALSCVALAWLCASSAHALDLGGAAVSADARYVAQWVLDSTTTATNPSSSSTRKTPRCSSSAPRAPLVGATPALLGFARGDHSVPGVGELAPSRIPLADRTTPAGRFDTEPGINLDGEDVTWIDYDAGLAIHRVRPGAAQQARLQRLASAAADQHRVSAAASCCR
jgi:hypothetical protein